MTSSNRRINNDDDGEGSSSSSDSNDVLAHNFSELKEEWKRQQRMLKQRLVTEDQFDFDANSEIKYIGGCDISFFKGNNVDAVASLVVVELPTMNVVYESYHMVQLTQPYIAGYLAFREVEHLLKLIDELRHTKPEYIPQILMVDGNGILHPRSFGIACQLGVMTNIPTIGVAKNLLVVDDLDAKQVKQQAIEEQRQHDKGVNDGSNNDNHNHHYTLLKGKSGGGKIWGGVIVKPNQSKPIYVSIGHKICLTTAVSIVKQCQIFSRIPEPIRQADLRSREYVRNTLLVTNIISKTTTEDVLRKVFGEYGKIRGVICYNHLNHDGDVVCRSSVREEIVKENTGCFAFVTFYKNGDAKRVMKSLSSLQNDDKVYVNVDVDGRQGPGQRNWNVEFATQPKGDNHNN